MDDHDHCDDDDVDEDLIEGDIEQGASSKALQDCNRQQVAPTRLQFCIHTIFSPFSVKFVIYPHLLHMSRDHNPNNHSDRTEEAGKSSNIRGLLVPHKRVD